MDQREGLSFMDAEDVNSYFERGKYFDLNYYDISFAFLPI